jgi:hypothetical protein
MDRIRKLTSGPRSHFYGYYGFDPWDASGRNHIALETDFDRRAPLADDSARVGLVDRETGAFRALAETRAFNFQQGSMLHWIDAGHGEEITYNDWEDGIVISRALDPRTGRKRRISRAVTDVAPDCRTALGVDYRRLYHCRKVVGYANPADRPLLPAPEDSGMWLIDLVTGQSRLVLSIATVARAAGIQPKQDNPIWLNHVTYSPNGMRVLFLFRMRTGSANNSWTTSFWTVNPDGTDLECRIPLGGWVSHYAWQDDRHLLVTTDMHGEKGFLLMEDHSPRWERFGVGAMPTDGHACYSPDRRWIVCDTYPQGDGRMQELMLYNPGSREKVVLGRFHSEPVFTGDVRCDLHPRWARDGRSVTIDTVDGGDRQIAQIDVSDIVTR